MENEQIMAGWVSLLGCLGIDLNGHLNHPSTPRRDQCGDGRSGQEDCHNPGDLSADSQAIEYPLKSSGPG